MNLVQLLPLLRDFIFIFFLFFESSFTGSGGTSYKFFDLSYGGELYFFWFLINTIISFSYNVMALHRQSTRKSDFTSFFYYFFSWLAVYQYGRQTAIDYQELGVNRNLWWALSNIETLGNSPSAYVESEPVHWAMVELFVYSLVIQDFIYCFRFIQKK